MYLLIIKNISKLSSKILNFSIFDLSEEENKALNTDIVDSIEGTNPQTLITQFNEVGSSQKGPKNLAEADTLDSIEDKAEIKRIHL